MRARCSGRATRAVGRAVREEDGLVPSVGLVAVLIGDLVSVAARHLGSTNGGCYVTRYETPLRFGG